MFRLQNSYCYYRKVIRSRLLCRCWLAVLLSVIITPNLMVLYNAVIAKPIPNFVSTFPINNFICWGCFFYWFKVECLMLLGLTLFKGEIHVTTFILGDIYYLPASKSTAKLVTRLKALR